MMYDVYICEVENFREYFRGYVNWLKWKYLKSIRCGCKITSFQRKNIECNVKFVWSRNAERRNEMKNRKKGNDWSKLQYLSCAIALNIHNSGYQNDTQLWFLYTHNQQRNLFSPRIIRLLLYQASFDNKNISFATCVGYT